MNNGYEQLSVDFTKKAQTLFISTYEKFKLSVKKLDRHRDENVFQLQLEKFISTLRLQLGNVAQELLFRNKEIKDASHCNKLLKDNIDIYIKEFRQKARSL